MEWQSVVLALIGVAAGLMLVIVIFRILPEAFDQIDVKRDLRHE